MAPTHFSLTSILLLSLLVIASASDYSYGQKMDNAKPDDSNIPQPQPDTPKPNLVQPETDVVKPNHESNPKPDLPEPKYTVPKPEEGHGSKPHLDQPEVGTPKREYVNLHHEDEWKSNFKNPKLSIPKPDTVKPYYKYDPKSDLPKPKSTAVPKSDNEYQPKQEVYQPKPKPDVVKPNNGYVQKPKPSNDNRHYESSPKPASPLPIGIEGLVVCKVGSKYTPIEGAVIRIACNVVDRNGYKTTPFSCLTSATDAKGYYYKTLPVYGHGHQVRPSECKAYLESSPSKTCKVPTDVNNGKSGALISSYNFHVLSDRKVKLYSLKPFFYTSEPASTTPAGY